ncbi:hypothetical protein GVN16_20510 [Emticicia sp. CRIBPO]|uniref:hypothetical protein n=1 Tax=Emticicia sp. CRIBPO TaxID=2683258 RepID=UPI00141250AD|nr:hypothetical protein [Emticicia sp. CRIBPO]NBA88167.1 hypothetical protein [Emticicia sp. CRIBPO]
MFGERTIQILILTLYFIWGVTGIFHHELWTDEFHSWLIASHSRTLGDLWHNIAYEGHPLGWYLILFLAAKAGLSFHVMQFIHLAVGMVCSYLILRLSPFNIIYNILIIFGGILGFEYLLLSRNYSIGLMIMLCALSMILQKKEFWKLALVLAVLTQFNLFATLISASLMLMLFVRKYGLRFWKMERSDFLASAVWFGGFIFFVITVKPPSDSFFFHNSVLNWSVFSEDRVRNGIKALIVYFNRAVFSKYSITYGFERFAVLSLSSVLLFTGLTFAYLLTFAVTLRKSKPALIFFITSLGLISIFIFISYYPAVADRHTMSVCIILLISLIIYHSEFELSGTQRFLILLPLVSIFMYGMGAYVNDFRNEFSSAKRISEKIRDEYPETPVVSYPDYLGEAVSGYLDKDLFHLTQNDFGNYVTWKKGVADRWDEDGLEFLLNNKPKMDVLKNKTSSDLLILTWVTIPDSLCKKHHFEKLQFNENQQTKAGDSFNVYRY